MTKVSKHARGLSAVRRRTREAGAIGVSVMRASRTALDSETRRVRSVLATTRICCAKESGSSRVRSEPGVLRLARRAFTMIEVMAVVVILAGIWVLVLPNFGTRDDLIAGSAARVLISDLLYAQNRAIATQTIQYVS